MTQYHVLQTLDQRPTLLGREQAVARLRLSRDGFGDCVQAFAGNTENDLSEHLHEPPVRIPGEPLVTGQLGQTFHRFVIETQVEDRVHHSRHRDRRPRPHREEQRTGNVTEMFAGDLLHPAQGRIRLRPQAFWKNVITVVVGAAGLGSDGEPGGHRKSGGRHSRQPRTFATEKLPHGFATLSEWVDPLLCHDMSHHHRPSLLGPIVAYLEIQAGAWAWA